MNFLARPFQLFIFLFAITNFSLAQSNNLASATSINPVTSCGATTGQTLYNANSDGPTNTCAGTANDVWYTFTTPSGVTSVQIDVTVGGGSNLDNTNAFIEAFNANSTAGVIAANTLGCNNIGSGLTLTGLVPSTLYYFRVFTSATPTTTPSNKWAFSICVSYVTPILPPSNDECSGATTLTIGSATAGTVWGATESSSIPAGCASGTPDDDVWYKFIATSSNVNVALSSIASDLNSAGAMLQLFSGACGSLNSVVCGYNSLSTTSLTSGNTYYIRVYSSSSGSIGGTSTGSTFSITVSNASTPSSTTLTSSRMNEVFKLTTISSAGNLNYPWEVTYGPDGYLWITEARGYKVVRMDPNTGQKNTVLDISQGSPFLPSIDQGFNLQFDFGGKGNPQGGLAGLALHPLFLDAVTPKNFVYVSYIHTWVSGSSSGSTEVIYVNRLVRFEYNTATGFLQNPVSLCDTLPGSSDHNSQRMIIAPVSGTYYLFYASGDMGAGQYSNLTRTIKSQDQNSYEGKILRFNLEPVSGSWIPTDNPFGSNSAVWSTGIRNNQGFAYTNINGTGYLYGSSHGPYSDDEINIIEKGKNYGHPLVIGYSGDGNYDGAAAGPSNGSAPPITSESTNASVIGSSYRDPIFTFYPAPKGNTTTANTIQYMWSTNPPNSGWPSEAPSGLDVYANTLIPGWKNSLVSSALKWGRLVRLKLNSTGTGVQSISGQDTATYFDNPNRYRDLAFSPDGKDIYIVMDNNSATSGPGTNNPSIVNCAGCVHKYTFLGYNHNSSTNRSTIPSAIDITSGTSNTLSNGTTITIDATNSNLWVPITGPDGNIMAEIKANGNILGTVTSTFYTSGTVREDANKRLYLNRSITITPQNQPTSTVNVRLYITSAELTALIGATNSQGAGSGVSGIGDLKILKNADANSTALTASALTITPTYAEAFAGTSNGGYVLQADITSFSSFYFENPSNIVLPLELVSFKGILKNNDAHLNWESSNENNTSHFIVERSIDGQNFEAIGKVNATGNATGSKYGYIDYDAEKQSSSTVYYRLKMVDKDKAFTYSQIISLNIVQSNMPITAYPNPVNDVLNLKLSVASSERIHIQVTDMHGRTIYSKIKIIRAGADEIKINTKPWAAQSYYINVYDSKNKILFSQKLVKM